VINKVSGKHTASICKHTENGGIRFF